MKLGLALPVFSDDPSAPLRAAERAAAAGYDGVFSADHLIPPAGAGRPTLEAFTTLSAVAVANPGLTVGTLVARVTLRPPGILAKQAAMLDHLSGGNAIVGLGTGDAVSTIEHETFGIDLPSMADRRELLAETAEALRALFDGGVFRGGAHVPPMRGPLLPPGHPAIWVGGISEAAVRLAARVGDGWNGWALDAEGFARRAALLSEAAGEEGRRVVPTWGAITLVGEDHAELERLLAARADKGLSVGDAWTGTAEELRAFAAELDRAGCAWMIVLVAGPADRADLIAETLADR
jgi:alkanesulfonate monooxygenase SsuD/methylene tetrahydromethanopterin reductase-like flavin-dependent oxidoreductase (luciferase family)